MGLPLTYSPKARKIAVRRGAQKRLGAGIVIAPSQCNSWATNGPPVRTPILFPWIGRGAMLGFAQQRPIPAGSALFPRLAYYYSAKSEG